MARFRWLLPLFLLAAPAAHAKCASPGAFVVPDGGPLPMNPRLHVFVPAWRDGLPKLDITNEDGVTLDHTIVAVTSSKAFDVFQVDVRSVNVETIHVEIEGARRKNSYAIDRGWKAPSASPVRVTTVGESSFEWTCSNEEARLLTPDTQAPLYRVTWAQSEEAFRAGKHESVLLPNLTKALAWNWEGKPVKGAAELPLGKLNCSGNTLEWQGPIWAAVVAIHPDGTETPLGDPIEIAPPVSSKGRSRLPRE